MYGSYGHSGRKPFYREKGYEQGGKLALRTNNRNQCYDWDPKSWLTKYLWRNVSG